MAKDNSWMTIAEVYRDREHKLIRTMQDHLMVDIDVTDAKQLYEWMGGVNALLNQHLVSTGRTAGKPVEVPVIIPPVDGARSELLALLGASEGQGGAHSGPVQVRTRKVRSDKGKPRGPRKKKVVV